MFDCNRDRYDDIIIGAPNYDSDKGRAYVFFGSSSPPSSLNASSQSNLTLTGSKANDLLGFSVASAGDVNQTNSGYKDDFIVGAPGCDSNKGRAYIYYGGREITGWLDDSNMGNTDGYPVGPNSTWRAVCFYPNDGNILTNVSIELADWEDNTTATGVLQIRESDESVDPAEPVNGLDNWLVNKTFSKPAGRVNITVDFPDIAINTSRRYWICVNTSVTITWMARHETEGFESYRVRATSTDYGATWAGYTTKFMYNFRAYTINANVTLAGENANDKFGFSVFCAGDVNNDGYDDVIIGAPGYNSNQGKVYIYFGNDCMEKGGAGCGEEEVKSAKEESKSFLSQPRSIKINAEELSYIGSRENNEKEKSDAASSTDNDNRFKRIVHDTLNPENEKLKSISDGKEAYELWKEKQSKVASKGFKDTDVSVNGTSLAGNQYWPSVATGADGRIYVVWTNYNTDPHTIWCAVSTDGGGTFGTSVMLPRPSTSAGRHNYDSHVAVHGTGSTARVHVVWAHVYSGDDRDIYYANSTDGGASFQANAVSIATTTDREDRPDIAVDAEGNPHLAWVRYYQADSTYNRVYTRRSTDQGATWQSAVIVAYGGTDKNYNGVAIAVNGTGSTAWVHVAYQNSITDWNYYGKIYYNKSADGGATYGTAVNVAVDEEKYWIYSEDLDVGYDGNPHITYAKHISTYAHDIYYNRSTDGGSSFLAGIVIASPKINLYINVVMVRIALDGRCNPFIVWYDNRTGNNDTYLVWSDDGGSTFVPSSQALKINSDDTSYNQENPSIAVYGGNSTSIDRRVDIVWEDSRSGTDRDIYYDGCLQYNTTFKFIRGNPSCTDTTFIPVTYYYFNTSSTREINATLTGKYTWADNNTTYTYTNPNITQADVERWNSSSANATGLISSENLTIAPIYYHQWNVTYNYQKSAECTHTLPETPTYLNYTYYDTGKSFTGTYNTYVWSDCESTTDYNWYNVSRRARWKPSPLSQTVSTSTTYTITYYHQWNITVSTSGGFLNSTYSSTLYYYDAGTQYSTTIYDGISPAVVKWCDCGRIFNVSTPVKGPWQTDYPRNVTYYCDEPKNVAIASRLYTFMFYATFPGDVNITGEADADSQFGYSVSGNGDFNGDGIEDVLVGAPYWTTAGTVYGRAYMFFGNLASGIWSIGKSISAENANKTYTGDGADDNYGFAVYNAFGDVNGDGCADFLVGAPRNDTPGQNDNRGRVYCYELGEYPTVIVNFTSNDPKQEYIGERSFETTAAQWYNLSVPLIGTPVVRADYNITLRVNVTTTYGYPYIKLFYDSATYSSKYEYGIPTGKAQAKWVR
ncbi:MAG: hypothetical protein QME47_06870, partial [Candidatus Thermoplasmatota archaeon]|nr:hypothetical protein [Candidatus Thermoplasmatota archaeon]